MGNSRHPGMQEHQPPDLFYEVRMRTGASDFPYTEWATGTSYEDSRKDHAYGDEQNAHLGMSPTAAPHQVNRDDAALWQSMLHQEPTSLVYKQPRGLASIIEPDVEVGSEEETMPDAPSKQNPQQQHRIFGTNSTPGIMSPEQQVARAENNFGLHKTLPTIANARAERQYLPTRVDLESHISNWFLLDTNDSNSNNSLPPQHQEQTIEDPPSLRQQGGILENTLAPECRKDITRDSRKEQKGVLDRLLGKFKRLLTSRKAQGGREIQA